MSASLVILKELNFYSKDFGKLLQKLGETEMKGKKEKKITRHLAGPCGAKRMTRFQEGIQRDLREQMDDGATTELSCVSGVS